MKRFLTIFGNFTVILAAVSCVTGALISAFSFTVDALPLFQIWAIAALALSIHASFWRVKGILVLLAPLLALIVWRMPQIVEGAKYSIFFITTEYNKWLFVPILFSDAKATAYELTDFFAVFGIAVAFLLSVAICLRRSTFLTVLFTAPFVFLTFVLVFFPPEPIFLFCLIAVYLTLLFSNGFYPDDYAKRGTAVFPALALAAVLMSIALFLAPPDKYNREETISSIDNHIRQFASRIGIARVKSGVGWPVASDDTWGFNTSDVGISEAGTRNISDKSLLEITVTEAGVFYLRGYSMQHFEKGRWTVNSESTPFNEEALVKGLPAFVIYFYHQLQGGIEPEIVDMTIDRTGDVTRNVVYTPYYSLPGRMDVYPNRPYSFVFFYEEDSVLDLYSRIPDEYLTGLALELTQYSEWVRRRNSYLQIEDSTAEGLLSIALEAGIDPNADRAAIAGQVAEYLSSFGRYTLSPFVIPEGEDFALYFLETSRQGYCIHYATTATLMLRALGVPARFTSGFVAAVSRDDVGQPLIITDRNAHSWVEVYFDEVGWLPIEVTPPATGAGLFDGRPPAGGAGFSTGQGFNDYEDDPFMDWLMDPDYPDPHDTEWQASDINTNADAGVTLNMPKASWSIIPGVIIAAIFISLIMRRVITRRYRLRRFAQEDTNASVIFAWRYLSRLMKFRRWEQPPKELEELALKARFSQHRISEEERSAVTGYALQLADKVYQNRTWLGQFWIKCIRGL